MSYITNPGGEYAGIHYLQFNSLAERTAFNDYAINHPDGLPVARGAAGNMFVTPYNDIHNDGKSYMFSRWHSEDAWDSYTAHRREISSPEQLPYMQREQDLRLRELDISPTKNTGQGLFYSAPIGSVCNIHILQFDSAEARDEVYQFWGTEEGLPLTAEQPGNIVVSGFEAIEKNYTLVAVSAWENDQAFANYLQMRRESAPALLQAFLTDELLQEQPIELRTLAQGTLMDPDNRGSYGQ